MRISTFGYVGKQGVKNIWRNKMFSLASIATMSACIFLFGLFFAIVLTSIPVICVFIGVEKIFPMIILLVIMLMYCIFSKETIVIKII